MLFLPFTKNWWSAFVRGDESAPGRFDEDRVVPGEGADEPSVETAEEASGGQEPPVRGRRFEDRPRRDRGYRAGAEEQPAVEAGRLAGGGAEPESGEDDADDTDHEDGAEPAAAGGGLDLVEEDDPLAPAYDLDLGEPLEDREPGRRRPTLSHEEIRSAKDFFNSEITARFDLLDSESRQELAGSYRVELKGYSGGIWTINIGDDVTVVNRREEADVVLTMQQRDFLQLVNGEINPQLAIVAQKLRLAGDIRKGVSAQMLFSPLGE